MRRPRRCRPSSSIRNTDPRAHGPDPSVLPAALPQLLEGVVEKLLGLFFGTPFLHVREVGLVRLGLGQRRRVLLVASGGRRSAASRSCRGSPLRGCRPRSTAPSRCPGRPSTRSRCDRRGSRGPARPSGRRRRACPGSHFRRWPSDALELRDEAEGHDGHEPRQRKDHREAVEVALCQARRPEG